MKILVSFKTKNVGRICKKLSDIHDLNTRSKSELKVSFDRLNISIKSPNSLGITVFKNLPHIKKCDNCRNLKNIRKNFCC